MKTQIDTEVAKLIITQLDERCAARVDHIWRFMPGHDVDTDCVIKHVKELRAALWSAIKESEA